MSAEFIGNERYSFTDTQPRARQYRPQADTLTSRKSRATPLEYWSGAAACHAPDRRPCLGDAVSAMHGVGYA
ncbi:MAG: hypothetical protein ABI612_23900 [Betaproteobacteria bacterium]